MPLERVQRAPLAAGNAFWPKWPAAMAGLIAFLANPPALALALALMRRSV